MKLLVLINEAIKLGQSKAKPAHDAFMKEFFDETHPHPFDRSIRLKGDVGLTVYPVGERIHFATIMNFGDKNAGHSTKAIKWLTTLADKYGVEMELEPVPIKNAGSREGKNLNKTELTAWYKRMGFIKKDGALLVRPVNTSSPSQSASEKK